MFSLDLTMRTYIRFSRPCWYGLEMLTSGTQPLTTALLDDGITVDFVEFALFGVDCKDEIAAKPFGDGLQVWMKRSPGFHLEKINSPVLIQCAVSKRATASAKNAGERC